MRTAIVVDDEPITKMDLTEILLEAQFDVVAQGSDGFDAVELCRQHNPDIVLMDIKMPVFDGLSAAETILRENLAGSVVLLTAFSNADFIEKAKQIGVAGYLIKPVEERMVVPTLEIALAQSTRYIQALGDARALKQQLEEKTLVDRAKMIVARRDGIPEGEAYERLRKMSMDKRCGMGEIATMIVASGSARETVEKAKQTLIRALNLNENTAYRRIKDYSNAKKCTMEQAAVHLINTVSCAAVPRGKPGESGRLDIKMTPQGPPSPKEESHAGTSVQRTPRTLCRGDQSASPD
ncbi:MAG: ANTAR domain-containing protein [Oscillospiraceae bacterium]|jgi:response regulator NasT|nr:ANTAR domain-containing protein [Oscillospiraceae bacterium]